MSIAEPIELTTHIPVKRPAKKRKPDAAPTAFGPQKHTRTYYNYGPVCSYNAMWHFIVGGRGLGKTYGAKKRALKRAIEHGEMFIYLRRYEEELKTIDTFFADIQHEWEDQWDFEVIGRRFRMAPASTRDDKKRDWRIIGYALALSRGQYAKSVAFPLVTTIIFDEFIIEKGVIKYITNEADVFKNFYNTVDRTQDKTLVFFLANSVSIANPYFMEFDIVPNSKDEIIRDKSKHPDTGEPNRYWVAHFPKAEEYRREVRGSRFGGFTAGTDYDDYAFGNQFADNHLGLIKPKTQIAKHMFNLETKLGTISLWHDIEIGEYYASRKVPTNQRTMTLVVELMTEQKTLLTPSDQLVKMIVTAFRHRRMWFDTPLARSMWFDVMRIVG